VTPCQADSAQVWRATSDAYSMGGQPGSGAVTGATARAGLTLAELLIVLALLGLMMSTILASAAYVLERARERDAQGTLEESWKLARAMSAASGEPVWWQLAEVEGGLEVSLQPLTARGEDRTISLPGWKVMASGESEELRRESGRWSVLVAPHGLTADAVFTLSRAGAVPVVVKLKGVVDDPPSSQQAPAVNAPRGGG
jgi:prepilin-type N-terminal cleavage/methylation domain-containing protein